MSSSGARNMERIALRGSLVSGSMEGGVWDGVSERPIEGVGCAGVGFEPRERCGRFLVLGASGGVGWGTN